MELSIPIRLIRPARNLSRATIIRQTTWSFMAVAVPSPRTKHPHYHLFLTISRPQQISLGIHLRPQTGLRMRICCLGSNVSTGLRKSISTVFWVRRESRPPPGATQSQLATSSKDRLGKPPSPRFRSNLEPTHHPNSQVIRGNAWIVGMSDRRLQCSLPSTKSGAHLRAISCHPDSLGHDSSFHVL